MSSSTEPSITCTRSFYDFVVIGAGITGCTLAVGLKKQGYEVLLIEKEKEVQDRFKGEFLQPYALEVLRRNGFAKILDESDGRKITELRFRDLKEDSPSGISSQVVIPYPRPRHALAIPHRELLSRLRAETARLLGDSYLDGASWRPVIDEAFSFDEKPRLIVKRWDGSEFEIEAKILVGADGRNSRVRSVTGAPIPPKSAPSVLGGPEEMIVGCEAENLGLPSFRYEVLRTSSGGTVSIFPITENRARIYWHTSETSTDDTTSLKDRWILSLEKVFAEIAVTAGIRLQRPEKIAGSSAMTCFLGQSSQNRVFLVGDAVAVTTPLGGQGMTCGLYQVEKLLETCRGFRGSDLLEGAALSVLAEQHKKNTNYIFSHFTVLNTGLYYLFFSKLPFSKKLTRHVLTNWGETPDHVMRLAGLFGGVDLDTPSLVEVMKLWGVPLLGAKRLQESRVARLGHKINPAPILSWIMNQ